MIDVLEMKTSGPDRFNASGVLRGDQSKSLGTPLIDCKSVIACQLWSLEHFEFRLYREDANIHG